MINPVSAIFTWTTGLMKRAIIDKNNNLKIFCVLLEKSVTKTIEEGALTRELSKVFNR